MTNDFLEKFIHKKVSPWDKGALIYHKGGIARSPREIDFAILLKNKK